MRKILKRMLALSLILALGLLTIPAQASQVSEEAQLGQAETVTPVVTEETEYEMHSRLISCSDAELMDAGLTEAEIEELREFSFEEAFLERAQLDRESLAALGYTEEQINVLKAYKGEPITDDSPILLASATCSGYFSYVSTGTNSLSFNYHWIWSAPPMAFFY